MNAPGRMLRNLARRVRQVVSRGVVSLVNDALTMQGLQVQVLEGEARDNLERFQEYGFTSVPHAGAECVVVYAGGGRSHGLVIAVEDRRYRLTGLADGEVALYDDLGSKVVLKRGNVIEVTAATRIDLLTPLTHLSGDLKVDGDIVADGDISDHTDQSMLGMRDIYNTHTHPENDAGGPTSAPIEEM